MCKFTRIKAYFARILARIDSRVLAEFPALISTWRGLLIVNDPVFCLAWIQIRKGVGGGGGGGGLGACPPEIFQKCMVIMCVLVQIYTINLEDARPLCLPPSTPPLSDSGCSSLFIERRRRRKNFFHGRPTIRSLPEGFNTFIPFGFVMPTCTLVLCYNRPTRPATILTIKWEHWTFKWSKKFLVDVAT